MSQYNALALQDRPDPSMPDVPFIDGDHSYSVVVCSAMFPSKTFGYANMPRRYSVALQNKAWNRLMLPFDRRWKVAIIRIRNKRPASGRQVVDVQFFASPKEAEDSRRSILTNWRNGQFSEAKVLSWKDQHALRLSSKQAVGDPTA